MNISISVARLLSTNYMEHVWTKRNDKQTDRPTELEPKTDDQTLLTLESRRDFGEIDLSVGGRSCEKTGTGGVVWKKAHEETQTEGMDG